MYQLLRTTLPLLPTQRPLHLPSPMSSQCLVALSIFIALPLPTRFPTSSTKPLTNPTSATGSLPCAPGHIQLTLIGHIFNDSTLFFLPAFASNYFGFIKLFLLAISSIIITSVKKSLLSHMWLCWNTHTHTLSHVLIPAEILTKWNFSPPSANILILSSLILSSTTLS